MSKYINLIWEKIGEATKVNIDAPTHLLIPHSLIEILINELDELNSILSYDEVFQGLHGTIDKIVTAKDISEHFGLAIVVPIGGTSEIKILTEVKADI